MLYYTPAGLRPVFRAQSFDPETGTMGENDASAVHLKSVNRICGRAFWPALRRICGYGCLGYFFQKDGFYDTTSKRAEKHPSAACDRFFAGNGVLRSGGDAVPHGGGREPGADRVDRKHFLSADDRAGGALGACDGAHRLQKYACYFLRAVLSFQNRFLARAEFFWLFGGANPSGRGADGVFRLRQRVSVFMCGRRGRAAYIRPV